MNHTQIMTKFVQKLAYIFRMTRVASDRLMRLLLYGYLSVASNAAVDIHSFFFPIIQNELFYYNLHQTKCDVLSLVIVTHCFSLRFTQFKNCIISLYIFFLTFDWIFSPEHIPETLAFKSTY
jgi:hypothetical protein